LYDLCQQEVSRFLKSTTEEIIISASTIPGSHILPKFIAEFRINNPNVDFKIAIKNSQKALEDLKNGLADFAGIGSFMKFDKEDFDIINLGEDRFKFICSPNHELLKNGNNITFDNLKSYPFIWREKGSGMRNTFKQQFRDYKKLNVKLEINDNDSIISTVSESNYISIMSEFMINKAESAGLVKSIEINEYPIIAKRSLFFVKLKNKELSELKKKFWNELNSNVLKKED